MIGVITVLLLRSTFVISDNDIDVKELKIPLLPLVLRINEIIESKQTFLHEFYKPFSFILTIKK